MKSLSLVEEWLKRAKSNLLRARAGKISEGILYEDLCFDCEQAVEKSLKGLLVHQGVSFPKTHSIAYLIELVEDRLQSLMRIVLLTHIPLPTLSNS